MTSAPAWNIRMKGKVKCTLSFIYSKHPIFLYLIKPICYMLSMPDPDFTKLSNRWGASQKQRLRCDALGCELAHGFIKVASQKWTSHIYVLPFHWSISPVYHRHSPSEAWHSASSAPSWKISTTLTLAVQNMIWSLHLHLLGSKHLPPLQVNKDESTNQSESLGLNRALKHGKSIRKP